MKECVKKENSKIILQSFCDCGGKCYASAMKSNGLFQVEKDGHIKFIALFPNEEIEKHYLYVDAVSYQKYILFVPGAADNICIYDTEQQTFIVIPVQENDETEGAKNSKFCKAVNYQNYIYLFPERYNGIVKIECGSWKVSYINNWIPKEKVHFKKGISIVDNKLIMPSILSNLYMQFDFSNDEVEIKKMPLLGNGVAGAWSVCVEENESWFISRPKPTIYKVDGSNNLEEYSKFPDAFRDNGYAFTMGFLKEDYFYACPFWANMVIRVHKRTGKIEKAPIENLQEENCGLVYLCKIDNFFVFCRYNLAENIWKTEDIEHVFLDIENLRVYTPHLEMENELDYRRAIMQEKRKNGSILVEGNALNLVNFLALIQADSDEDLMNGKCNCSGIQS